MAKGWRSSGRRRALLLNAIVSAWRRQQKLPGDGGYDYFTTTLSISPLKNAQKINEIGEELAEIYGVAHLPSDFKKKNGYKRSIELSHEYDLYRQNYCGCVFRSVNRKEKYSKNKI